MTTFPGNFGLAHAHATPADETAYFLGSSFDFIELRERSESLAASTILDLACVLELEELYNTARNEFLAVDIVLPVIGAGDDQSQYCLHAGNHTYEPNMPYEEHWKPVEGWGMRLIIAEVWTFTIPSQSVHPGINFH